MKSAAFTLFFFVLCFQSHMSYGQTENYKKGIEAIQSNRYHEAMISFTKVVEDEKYEITGKDLSLAYAYLAVIRTAYLEKDLANSKFNKIITKQGHIKSTIDEMDRALQFQDNNTKSMLNDAKSTLIEISTNALQVIGDSLITYNEEQPNDTTNFIARFTVEQFGKLEEIDVDHWKLHDILGLAHYFLGEKEKAMTEFKKSRDLFSKMETQPNSQLHLKNFILSSNYSFNEQSDLKEAYKICDDGSKYTSVLINALEDDQMNEILQLNKIENRFRQYMTRIKESK